MAHTLPVQLWGSVPGFSRAAAASGAAGWLSLLRCATAAAARPLSIEAEGRPRVPFEELDRSVPYDVRVSGNSKAGPVAGFLLNAVREDRDINAAASGGAVYKFLRGMAVANNLLDGEVAPGPALAGKRLAVQPVLQPSHDGMDKATYQVDFQPCALDVPRPLEGYKEWRYSQKMQVTAFRAMLMRSLLEDGMVSSSTAGAPSFTRMLFYATEVRMRLQKAFPQLHLVIIPNVKRVEASNGALLHLTQLVMVRTSRPEVETRSWSRHGMVLIPQPLPQEEIESALPEVDVTPGAFVNYLASTARWNEGKPRPPREPRAADAAPAAGELGESGQAAPATAGESGQVAPALGESDQSWSAHTSGEALSTGQTGGSSGSSSAIQ